jgi:hypothetical protein
LKLESTQSQKVVRCFSGSIMATSKYFLRSSTKLAERGKLREAPPRYEYSKLEIGNDIRLIILLPGDILDHIRIINSNTTLVPPDQVSLPSTLWTKEELRQALPEGWDFFRTVDETFIFWDGWTEETPWTHPNLLVDPTRYQLPEDHSYPAYESKYEALSYTGGIPHEQTPSSRHTYRNWLSGYWSQPRHRPATPQVQRHPTKLMD